MQSTLFIQSPPELGNQYGDDAFLRAYLQRRVPAEVLAQIEPQLVELGELAGGELYRLQLQDRLNEPTLTQWDAWGKRIDRIEVSPLWRRAAEIAATHGLIGIPYERRHGRYSRIHQFAAVYLFHPSSDVYTCPLAMTDGAARTLTVSGNQALIDRAVTRLTSRDPAQAWTSGQWMTEATGGSDVGASLTRAVRDASGLPRDLPGCAPSSAQPSGQWRLYGKKWFTSAITSQMALTLARPEGNGPGGSGLAMFYVETHNEDGSLNGIRVERLKDKLGTRKVPTAELTLDGAHAVLVGDTRHGTRNIEPMLTVTRAWNSVTSVSFMRRALALARAYARQRRAFGAKLDQLPLHVDTLAGLEAETRGAFLLAFELVELMGRQEAGEIDDAQKALLRVITPIAKLLTAKQAVNVVSECIEAFGGAGYVEDTGLPLLLRDTQVLPIWEGTTNVLALDTVLRGELSVGLPALRQRIQQGISAGSADARLAKAGQQALAALEHVIGWLSHNNDPRRLQAHARRVAMTLGRALELALLVEAGDAAAACRFAAASVDLLVHINSEDSARLIE